MKHTTVRTALRTRIADLAGAQHGVASRSQLLEAGMTPRMIHGRLADGRLRSVHRGIYLVGPAAPPPRAREMAAVLACAPGGVLSHRSAAELLGLFSRADAGDPVDVSITAGQSGAGRAGIRVHRVQSIEPSEVTSMDRIPVTNALRTVLDLAALVPGRPDRSRTGPRLRGQRPPRAPVASSELERAVARAERMGLVELSDLRARIAERRHRPGIASLRRLLERDGAPAMTRSRAEDAFLSLVRGGRLPEPDVNAPFGVYEVDFLWRAHGLAVEVDGFAFHASRERFEGDRRRDAELTATGLQVIRLTWRQLTDEPLVVVGAVSRALGRAEAGMGRPMVIAPAGNPVQRSRRPGRKRLSPDRLPAT